MSESGIESMASRHSVKDTIDRLVAVVEEAGLHIFARVDHARNAAQVGLDLRPTEVLIFGNPKVGTPLMLDNQMSGIDLPLRVLAWEDEAGHVWLSHNTGEWLAKRHSLGEQSADSLAAISSGLAKLCAKAAEDSQ